MKNKKILILIIILVAIILVGIIIGVNFSKKDENQILAETEENLQSEETNNNVETNNNEIINNTGTTNNSETTNNNDTTNNIEATNNIEENSSLGGENMNNQNEEIKINLIVNNKTFSATLNNNETVKELTAMFPMTLNMSDLNSNEKYNYLDSRLTTNSSSPRRINAGDIKLYGNSCLVVFYESFNTSYSYTDLGKVDNAKDFVNELGRGNVTITFELAN